MASVVTGGLQCFLSRIISSSAPFVKGLFQTNERVRKTILYYAPKPIIDTAAGQDGRIR